MSIINLLPEDYLAERAKRRATMLFLTLFGLVMIGVTATTFISEGSERTTRTLAANVSAQYDEAAKQIDQMKALQQKHRKLTAKAEDTALLIERVPRSYLLAMVNNSCPEDLTLWKVQIVTEQENLKKATQPKKIGKRLTKKPPKKAKKNKKDKKSEDVKPPRPKIWTKVTVAGWARDFEDVSRLMEKIRANPTISSVDINYTRDVVRQEKNVCSFSFWARTKPDVDVLDVTESGWKIPADGKGGQDNENW